MRLFLAAVVVLFYWKLTLSTRYTWLDSPDYAYQVLPWYQFQAAEWHSGRLPLWIPFEWAGQSLIGQAQPGVAYPLNWALFLMPLREGWMRMATLNWYWVVIHFMGVLFAYALARDLGCGKRAAAFAGLAYGLGGWMGSTEWPQMLSGAVWLPLVILFLFRVLRECRMLRSAALAGAALGMAYLSGHHQVPTFAMLVAAGLWLYALAALRERAVAPLLAFGALFATVAALQVLPAVEYGRLAVRWVGSAHDPVGWADPVPYRVHSNFGLQPISLTGILVPGLYRHANPYFGFVAIVLAGLGAAVRIGRREVRLLLFIAIGGLLLSLSQFSLLHGLAYALAPMVEKARNPSMAIVVFHCGAAILAAFGIDALLERGAVALRWGRRSAWMLAAFAVFFAAVVFVLRNSPAMREFTRWSLVPVYAMLAALILWGALRSARFASAAPFALLAVALVEWYTGGSQWGWRPVGREGSLLPALAAHVDVARYVQSLPGPARIEIDNEAVPYNFGDWYGIDAFDTYTASMQTNIYQQQADFPARMLMAIGYYVGTAPRRKDQIEVFRSPTGLKVYANPQASPRVWTVHTVDRVPEFEVPFQWRRPLPELRERAFTVEPPPQLERCAPGDRTALLLREPAHISIDAEMRCTGMAVIAEPHFPGWRAEVDGRPAPIHLVYNAMRGVVVPAGKHRVDLYYRPRSVYAGAALTGLGWLAALVCWLFPRRDPITQQHATAI